MIFSEKSERILKSLSQVLSPVDKYLTLKLPKVLVLKKCAIKFPDDGGGLVLSLFEECPNIHGFCTSVLIELIIEQT